jgi:hypothetical protein
MDKSGGKTSYLSNPKPAERRRRLARVTEKVVSCFDWHCCQT